MNKGTFSHSVKVPKLYKCAAKISMKVAEGSSSIKQLVYEKTHFNTKALYALVVTAFQKANELDLLLKRTKLLEKESRFDPWLAKILISELLWGKKQLPRSDAKPILTILAYEQAFRAHLSDSSGDSFTAKPDICHRKPRYIRINTLKTTVNEALELFQEEGWTLTHHNENNTYKRFLEQVSYLEDGCFLRDFHIPDLLIFPGGTEFHNHPGYRKGVIILQDKASCLPVHILSPPEGSIILDMCAAPGMKTTQLAATLQDKGTVYAVERDPKRFEVLKKMVETSGATCVKVINQDVLQCSDDDFPNVEYILVDPSCSGSGMSDRLEIRPNQDYSRLKNLAGFQIKILRSALSRYPKAKKIVYSTCSLNPEENEDVVRQVLETNNNFKLLPAKNFIGSEWLNFGSPDFGNIGKYCLYAKPDEDLTNGFFLAVFERLEQGEYNEFFNGRVLKYTKDLEQKQARKDRRNNSFKKQHEHETDVQFKAVVEVCDTQSFEANNKGNLQSLRGNNLDHNSTATSKHTKKCSTFGELVENNEIDGLNLGVTKKKKKKHKEKTENYIERSEKDEKAPKKKLKKRKHNEEKSTLNSERTIFINEDVPDVENEKKKPKKESLNDDDCDVVPVSDSLKTESKKRKKREEQEYKNGIPEEESNKKSKKKYASTAETLETSVNVMGHKRKKVIIQSESNGTVPEFNSNSDTRTGDKPNTRKKKRKSVSGEY